MGRSPYQSAFARESADDRQRVDDALAHVDISALATRSFATLSGGEKQRALIARALVQEAGVLILDEPTNHLDIRHQFEVLDLVRGVGATTLTSIHDVNLAAEYCDYIVVLKGGRVQAVGPVETVLTPQVLEPQTRVWGDSRMRSAGRGAGPVLVPEPLPFEAGLRRDTISTAKVIMIIIITLAPSTTRKEKPEC